MAGMVKFSDFNPSVLRNIVGLTFLRSFIRIFRAYRIDVVFGLIVKLSVKMSKLMA